VTDVVTLSASPFDIWVRTLARVRVCSLQEKKKKKRTKRVREIRKMEMIFRKVGEMWRASRWAFVDRLALNMVMGYVMVEGRLPAAFVCIILLCPSSSIRVYWRKV
jgi:hypothetical protein